MLDAFGVGDIFVSGLGEVEDIGSGNLRFVFFSKQKVGEAEELVVVCNLVMPMDAVPMVLKIAAEAIAGKNVRHMN